MAEAYDSSIPELQCIEDKTCISSCDCFNKNNQVSIDKSIERTVIEPAESKEDSRLFMDVLDAFPGDGLSPGLKNVLSAIISSIKNLDARLISVEMEASRRTPPINQINWNEKRELAEFRIAENGGRIAQKDLQKKLGVRSRTTMTYLVSDLRSTGRYKVGLIGRCNYIEVIE